MTYAEIEARIVSDLNRSDMTSSVNGWVNDVYQELLGRRSWNWLTATAEVSTVVDVCRYELPPDYGDCKSLVVIDSINATSIPYITSEEFDKRYPSVDTDTAGVPEVFTVRHGINPSGVHYDELNVYPRSDATTYVMRMHYSIRPSNLSGTDQPIIPSPFHAILVYGGLEIGFARLREYDAAAYWMKKKELMYKAMEDDHTKFPSMGVIKPFNMSQTFPPEYWNRYTVRTI